MASLFIEQLTIHIGTPATHHKERPLLYMHLPEFKRGYENGRKEALTGLDTTPLTDEEVLDLLKTLVSDGAFTEPGQQTLQYGIGSMLGQLSVGLERLR